MPAKTKKKAIKPVPRRTRKDPLGEATRAALIEKAEAMFAEKGIDGVSIRQIGIAIGSANSNVVGYHFGTKEALVKAILQQSMPYVAKRRAELLDCAKRDKREHDLLVLLDALCRPIFELRRADGLHA
jgi:AcrR family transcriptional regulator